MVMGVAALLRVVWTLVVGGGRVEAVLPRTIIRCIRLVSSWMVREEGLFLEVRVSDWVECVVTDRGVVELEGKGDVVCGWNQCKGTWT